MELAAMPAAAMAGMLSCIVGAGQRTLAGSMADERRVVLATMGTADEVGGMTAFLGKRKPRFNRGS